MNHKPTSAHATRKLSAILLLLLLTATACTSSTPDAREPLHAFTQRLDTRVPRLLDRYGVPGASIALIRDGQLVWSAAYGYADRQQQRPMTVDTVYRVESISKSLTAWGLMRLVQQRQLALDDPVLQHLGHWQLPPSPYTEQGVTIRRLLTNSAGMPLGTIGPAAEYPPGSHRPSLRAFLSKETRLINEPGAAFLYSDAGYNLLELLIEETTGRDFSEYMTTELLLPLGMPNATFTWNDDLRSVLATGYDLHGAPVAPYVYAAHASGGLFATVEDIAHFVTAGMAPSHHTNDTLLTQDTIRAIHSPHLPIPGIYGLVADAYGFGHFTETLPGGHHAVWHGGQGHGWMTHFHAVPHTGDGIIILTNSQRSWPFIAHLLRDWSHSTGLGAPKMTRITHATTALSLLIALTLLLTLYRAYSILQDIRRHNRTFAPLSPQSRPTRLLHATLALTLLLTLTWAAAQPYLMLTSIFPTATPPLAATLLLLALTLLLSSLFPNSVPVNLLVAKNCSKLSRFSAPHADK